jgi:hypothetical protein
MAISAAWSERSERTDERGFHLRNMFPQLRENGLHDPDEDGIDERFIYPSSTIPAWMRYSLSSSPKDVIRDDSLVASVRYVQERDYPPSYVGLLSHFGVGNDFRDGTKTLSFGAGYGIEDDFLLVLRNPSGDAVLLRADDAWLLQTTAGITISVPRIDIITGTRIEAGYNWGLKNATGGVALAGGFESPTLPFHFTNAGIIVRLMYRFVGTIQRSHSVSFELVLQ